MGNPLSVGLVQGVGNRDSHLHGLAERQRATGDTRSERLALQVLHHQEVGVSLPADVEQRADVRMVQPGDGLRFALEALLHFEVLGKVRREHLDGHRAVQPGIGRLVYLAHAAGADRRNDLVGPESGAGLQ